MSDNPKQRRSGELKVRDDVWLSIFPFLGLAELAFVMALLSNRFDALVDIHFKTSKWALGHLEVHRSADGTGARIVKEHDDGIFEHLPIAQGPPPAKLIGFKHLLINYIDHTVIAFLRHILFDVGITLQLIIFESSTQSWGIIAQQIWPLLSSNINGMELIDETIRQLRSRISPTVLCDCANLRSICSDVLPQWPADDRREASDRQALTKWIHTPRQDGLPKTFQYCGPMLPDTVLNGFRETFLNASTAVNYIIVLNHEFAPAGDEDEPADYVPFDLKNEQTRERLAFRRQDNHAWLMERGPIVRDEKQWTEWKKEALEIEKNPVVFLIKDIEVVTACFFTGYDHFRLLLGRAMQLNDELRSRRKMTRGDNAFKYCRSGQPMTLQARQNFAEVVEEGINLQIRNELNASYAYLAMANYFNRVDVALPGAATFFAKQSVEERAHALKLIDYVNMRGGHVKLMPLAAPARQDWWNLHAALSDALDLEKMNNTNLLSLHKLASDNNDPDLTNFLEEFYLREQVDEIQRLARMANHLFRMGASGLGEHLFDLELQKAA
uniref:Ferritin n=1 Tax=Globodera rostochiensis TaxID=31243 RepID=A0A914HEM9_GLORO